MHIQCCHLASMFQVGNHCSFFITDGANEDVLHLNSYEIVSQHIMLCDVL